MELSYIYNLTEEDFKNIVKKQHLIIKDEKVHDLKELKLVFMKYMNDIYGIHDKDLPYIRNKKFVHYYNNEELLLKDMINFDINITDDLIKNIKTQLISQNKILYKYLNV